MADVLASEALDNLGQVYKSRIVRVLAETSQLVALIPHVKYAGTAISINRQTTDPSGSYVNLATNAGTHGQMALTPKAYDWCMRTFTAGISKLDASKFKSQAELKVELETQAVQALTIGNEEQAINGAGTGANKRLCGIEAQVVAVGGDQVLTSSGSGTGPLLRTDMFLLKQAIKTPIPKYWVGNSTTEGLVVAFEGTNAQYWAMGTEFGNISQRIMCHGIPFVVSDYVADNVVYCIGLGDHAGVHWADQENDPGMNLGKMNEGGPNYYAWYTENHQIEQLILGHTLSAAKLSFTN